MKSEDYDLEDIILEMDLEHIDLLPMVELQDLRRFKKVSNPSYHLPALKYRLGQKDGFLQAVQWLNTNLHRVQQWGKKWGSIGSERAEKQ